MEAQRIYAKLIGLAFKSASNLSKRRIHQMSIDLVELRHLLSCVVCCELLKDPFEPKERRCGHHVCRLCLRGRKRLFPRCDQCSDCCDYKTYEENKAMALLLLCYKTLCIHLFQSSLYAQLSAYPEICHYNRTPRIKLPPMTTHWFIEEGTQYTDMCDTFLTQHDMPFFNSKLSPSLPSETPPTTAATTPELPFEQHMPADQLSLSDIELEAAAIGDDVQFASPLPLMSPTSANMLHHNHMTTADHQPQQRILLPTSYIGDRWTNQVDLSEALTLPASCTAYVVNSNELHHMPAIGQVVQMATQTEYEPVVDASTLTEATSYNKRRHAEILDGVEVELQQEQDKVVQQLGEVMQQQVGVLQHQVVMHQQPQQVMEVMLKQDDDGDGDNQDQQEPDDFATHEEEDEEHEHEREQDEVQKEERITRMSTRRNLRNQQQEDHEQEEKTMRRGTRQNLRNQKPTIISSIQVKPPNLEAAAPLTVVPATAAPPAAPIVKKAISPAVVQSTASKTASAPATSTPFKSTGAPSVANAFRKNRPKSGPFTTICRCGTTTVPGRCTCRNSRCPCYMAGRSCKLSGCKCMGCKNPHIDKPDDGSDDDDDNYNDNDEECKPITATQTVKEKKEEQQKPTDATEIVPAPGADTGYTLVPAAQQSKHPLVFLMNETGDYQGFNIFNGDQPMHPAQLGFPCIPFPVIEGNKSSPEFMYIVPQPAMEKASTSTEKMIEPPKTKKIKNGSFIPDNVKVGNADADFSDLFDEIMPENNDDGQMPA